MLAVLSLSPTLALPKSPDIILSSGFLCFSSHAGALQALEAAGLTDSQSAVVGVSSGALAAAMLASGRGAADIGEQLSAQRPIKLVRPTITPWRGLCSTRALERRMRELLPATFEELERPLALGVFEAGTTKAELITSGDLPRAVAASCAVPFIFAPVKSGGRRLADGGAVDRTMTAAWRSWRPGRQAVVHLICREEYIDADTFSPRDGIDSTDGLTLVRTARAKASFLSLGDFDLEVEAARATAAAQLTANS